MSDTRPIVSINIPTLNSSLTLRYCLEAIQKQTYKNIQVIVIDSYSSDNTVEIALRYGAEVYFARGLLKQRLVGIHKSEGDYILLLDSDQVLEKTAIERCVSLEKTLLKPEALILNEVSVPLARGHISKMQAEYIKIINTGDWDPFWGTALPRFFPAEVLKKIPPTAREIGYFDHAYIYNQAIKQGISARFVPEAVIYHLEINTPTRMLKKFYKYYGFYILPALVEDWKLIFHRTLPRRMVLKGGDNIMDVASQLILYEVKALATLAGAFSYVLTDIMNKLVATAYPYVQSITKLQRTFKFYKKHKRY